MKILEPSLRSLHLWSKSQILNKLRAIAHTFSSCTRKPEKTLK
jgi:hypothetical protein